jgi:ribosomal protein S27E
VNLSARVLDIEARIAEHHDVTGLAFVTVICNDCGRTKTVYTSDLALVERTFAGWVIGTRKPYEDFCPRCT